MDAATALMRLTDCLDQLERYQTILEMSRDMENYTPHRASQYDSEAAAQLSYCLILLDTFDRSLTESIEDMREILRAARESWAPQEAHQEQEMLLGNPSPDRKAKKLALIAN